jgi:putative transposase
MSKKDKTNKNYPKFDDATISDILKNYSNPQDFADLWGGLKKAVIERALEGELTHHLGYPKHAKIAANNNRNGSSSKTIKTEDGEISIEIPRDRESSFEPALIKKNQTRFEGFDSQIISMYARGMSMREIQDHILDMYGTEVSTEFISSVTDSVLEEVVAWQNRPLDGVYPIVYLDAMVVKIKENNQITNKALYLALGVNMDGNKEILGMWIAKNEGAKFWLSVITELKNRGIEQIYIACVDGLKGFPEAINTIFPETQVQLCIVHMVRHSLNYVPWKDQKAVAADLREIYTAPTVEIAEVCLNNFRHKWDRLYPTIADSWKRNWHGIIPFLSYPNYIRKAIYTTNAIESINRQIRKIIKSKGSFPNDESVMKLVFLALQNAQKRWTMPIRDWKLALNQFTILFGPKNLLTQNI